MERAEETSRLVNFAHALTRIPELKSVAAAAATHIPLLVPNRRAWVMIRAAGVWEPLMTVGDTPPADRERAARRAMGEGGLQVSLPTDDECFPVVIADTPVCVLGLASEPPLTAHQRSVLTTAVALLAASLKNAELLQELHENGLQDGLTGCFNRTHAIDSLDIELKRARRTKRPLSVLMFDLDSFKLINDRHGHLCGDAVLAAVGDRMRGATRAGDLKCRYGGDEFIVLLPETPLAGAKLVCENLRKAIEKDPIPVGRGADRAHGQLRSHRDERRRGRPAGRDRSRGRGALSRQARRPQSRLRRRRIRGDNVGPGFRPSARLKPRPTPARTSSRRPRPPRR